MKDGKLLIYKASAGSGKTYTLVSSITSLLFKNPKNYKKILATTFTKAAANNIKLELAKRLFLLSQDKFEGKDHFIKEYGISNYSKEKAFEVLENFLFHYSELSIETMDSFFFRIIQSFSKELGISADVKIEQGEIRYWQEAAKSFFNQLGTETKYQELLKFLVLDRVEDGKRFTIRTDIQKDVLKLDQVASKLEAANFEIDQVLGLNDDLRKTTQYYQNAYNDLRELLEGFHPGNCIARYKNQLDFIDNPSFNEQRDLVEYFYEKGLANQTKSIFLKGSLDYEVLHFSQAFDEFEAKYSPEMYKNKIRKAMKPLFYSTAVYSAVRLALEELKEKDQVIFFSDTTKILAKHLNGENINDIYYKLGSKYKYILIDEFQDTNPEQWKIFKPLVVEALQDGGGVMLVGDAKQSIYGFRKADPILFTTQIPNDFDLKPFIENHPLDSNFRSHEGIIRFNNFFFNTLKSIPEFEINPIISKTYEELSQKSTKEGESEVYFTFLNSSGDLLKTDILEETFKDTGLRIYDLIYNQNLLPSDICVLFRGNNEINLFAGYLLKNYPMIKFTSKKGLNISTSDFFSIVIESLKFLDFPSPERRISITLLIAKLIYKGENYQQFIQNSHLWENENPFGEYFESLKSFAYLNSFQAFKSIISLPLLQWKENDLVGHKMLEIVMEYYESNLDLSTWDLINYIITYPDLNIFTNSIDEESIKLETIHASKGLEYNTVIMPLAHFHHKTADIEAWYEPLPEWEEQFKLFRGFFSKLSNIKNHLEDDYKNEIEKLIQMDEMETLNILYVAFTRAKKRLYISCMYPKYNKDGTTLGYLSAYKVTHQIGPLLIKHKLANVENYSYGFPQERDSTL